MTDEKNDKSIPENNSDIHNLIEKMVREEDKEDSAVKEEKKEDVSSKVSPSSPESPQKEETPLNNLKNVLSKADALAGSIEPSEKEQKKTDSLEEIDVFSSPAVMRLDQIIKECRSKKSK